MNDNSKLEIQFETMYKILNEIKDMQTKQLATIIRNQSNILKKLNKLQEYNEIDDMVNSIIDRRLVKIEQKLTN